MIHLIYNPMSGTYKKRRALRKIMCYLNKKNYTYGVHPTEYRGHCADIIRQLEEEGERDFVIFGGDGTYHEALNGITRLDTTRLLLIPCGSGNDFINANKSLKASPVKLIRRLLAGKTRKVDFIQFDNGKRCLNIAGTGLDIEVLQSARAYRKLTGKPHYFKALLHVMKHFNPYTIEVNLNGETHSYEALLVAVANGKMIGGGMKVAPHGVIDDGWLNVVVIKMVDRKKVKYVLPNFLTGRHSNKYYSLEFLTDAVEIKIQPDHPIQLDGEIYRYPFACRIEKSALTLFG